MVRIVKLSSRIRHFINKYSLRVAVSSKRSDGVRYYPEYYDGGIKEYREAFCFTSSDLEFKHHLSHLYTKPLDQTLPVLTDQYAL